MVKSGGDMVLDWIWKGFQMMDGVRRTNLHTKANWWEKAKTVCGIYGSGGVYIRVNREPLWQVLRFYGGDGKLLNGFNSTSVNSLDCVGVKGGESKCLRMEWCEKKLYHVPLVLQCIWIQWWKREGGHGSDISGRREREWRLTGLLFADELILCGESEEDLKVMVGHLRYEREEV